MYGNNYQVPLWGINPARFLESLVQSMDIRHRPLDFLGGGGGGAGILCRARIFFFARFHGPDYFFPMHTMLEFFFETIFFFLMGRMRARLFFSTQVLDRLFFLAKIRARNFFSKKSQDPPPPPPPRKSNGRCLSIRDFRFFSIYFIQIHIFSKTYF